MFGTKVLEERESKYNGHLRAVKTIGLGTYIQANGLTQSGGIVKTFWKQTFSRVKGKGQGIKECLILGLGGGTAAKLVRKFWPETKITGVDIDLSMVEFGKKYLELDKINIEIKIQDAIKPVSGKFDLVIIDLYNGDQFPVKFESGRFLRSLTNNKLVIFNRLYSNKKKDEADKFGNKLKNIFKNVEVFRPVTNIMYICRK